MSVYPSTSERPKISFHSITAWGSTEFILVTYWRMGNLEAVALP